MNRPSETQIAAFNADFAKLFVSAFGIGIVIFGYAYSHSFYKSFGISLFQLEMEWVDILFRGTALIQDIKVALLFLIIIIIGSTLFAMRNIVSQSWQLFLIAIAVFGIILSATKGGQALGRSHAKSIWADGKGKIAFCTLDTSKYPEFSQLSRVLNEQAMQQRVRFILKTNDYTYLVPVVEKLKPKQNTGESYVIPNSAISFCRIVGS